MFRLYNEYIYNRFYVMMNAYYHVILGFGIPLTLTDSCTSSYSSIVLSSSNLTNEGTSAKNNIII